MKRITALILSAILFCLTFCGCSKNKTVRVAVVTDTVGVSFAYMVAQSEQNLKDKKYEGTNFKFTVVSTYEDAHELLLKKKVDIITTTTPEAAKLYNKNDGKYVLSAVISYAPLYILESSVESEVSSMKDLRAKVIYAKQKGSFTDTILQYALKGNRLDPKINTTVEYFDSNSAVNDAFYEKESSLCYVAEPAATAIKTKSDYTKIVIDINDEWDKIYPNTPICYIGLVSSEKFAKKNKAAINDLLDGYKWSYEQMSEGSVIEFNKYCKEYGLSGGSGSAISMSTNAKPTVLTGGKMQAKTSAFFDLIYEQNKNIFGQILPDEEFYFDITE